MTDAPTFEQFSSALLSAWSEDLPDGDTVSSPKVAAAEAGYAAAIEHPRKRGTILIATDDAGRARQAVQYLASFFADQDTLRPLLHAQEGDTFELTGGRRIVVTTDATRRPAACSLASSSSQRRWHLRAPPTANWPAL